jgi:hypothetical protein
MENLLIGAISGNYEIKDISRWIESSNEFNCDRILLLYNNTNQSLSDYIMNNNVDVIVPEFDFHATQIKQFETNTANNNLETSYNLIHNIRFLHIWKLLNDVKYEKVLVTDVRDVYFNNEPFDKIPNDMIVASSEEIEYEKESWNNRHMFLNLGIIGTELLSDKKIYNVGVFGGGGEYVKNISRDIYLMSVGKQLVADQTSFNYLIQTSYKNNVLFTDLKDKFAVHLDVVSKGLVDFDLSTMKDYSIIHQYDRL